jgi:hypothetical protein
MAASRSMRTSAVRDRLVIRSSAALGTNRRLLEQQAFFPIDALLGMDRYPIHPTDVQSGESHRSLFSAHSPFSQS